MSRIAKLSSFIRREVANIILKEFADRNMGLVSITDVELRKDLSVAKIYYSHLGSKTEREKADKVLLQSAGYLKGRVGRLMYTQTVPDFIFVFDDSIARGTDLVNKLNRLSS